MTAYTRRHTTARAVPRDWKQEAPRYSRYPRSKIGYCGFVDAVERKEQDGPWSLVLVVRQSNENAPRLPAVQAIQQHHHKKLVRRTRAEAYSVSVASFPSSRFVLLVSLQHVEAAKSAGG